MTSVARLEALLSVVQKNRGERAYLMLPFEQLPRPAPRQEPPHAWVDHGPRHEVGGAAIPAPERRPADPAPAEDEREGRVQTKPQLPAIPPETPQPLLTLPEAGAAIPLARSADTAPEIVVEEPREVELTEEELLAAEVADDEVDISDEPSEPPTQYRQTGSSAPAPSSLPAVEPETRRGSEDSALRTAPSIQLPTGKGQLVGEVAPHSEESITQPKPTLEPITEPKPALDAPSRSEHTIEPVTQPRPETQRISSPPPLPLSELGRRARTEADEPIADPSTEVSGLHEAPVSPPPVREPDAITSKMPQPVERVSPPPLPVMDAPVRPGKTQVSFDAPPSPTPAPVIQEQADAGRKVISPKVLQPPRLEADAVGEFIGEIEAPAPVTFGAIIDASLSLEL